MLKHSGGSFGGPPGSFGGPPGSFGGPPDIMYRDGVEHFYKENLHHLVQRSNGA
jgi:hypothetical protein